MILGDLHVAKDELRRCVSVSGPETEHGPRARHGADELVVADGLVLGSRGVGLQDARGVLEETIPKPEVRFVVTKSDLCVLWHVAWIAKE